MPILVWLLCAPHVVAEPESRLQGTATHGRLRRVVGATVTVGDLEDPGKLWITSTDDGGRFRVENLPDGRYRVVVDHEAYRREVKEPIPVRHPFRAVVDLPMEPATGDRVGIVVPDPRPASGKVSVRGTVESPAGALPADVRVRLVRWHGGDDPREVRPDVSGRFAIDEIATGDWRIEVGAPGALTTRCTVALDVDAELRVRLVPPPAGHEPGLFDLMPEEVPPPPPGLSPRTAK